MGRLEELHDKELKIWAQMKTHYEDAAVAKKRKIENLKKALEDLQTRMKGNMDCIHTLLQTKHERVTAQLQAA